MRMSRWDRLGHFDLRRLTWLGRVVLVISIAAGIAGYFVVYHVVFGALPRKQPWLIAVVAGLGTGLGAGLVVFFLCGGLLRLVGVATVRPPEDLTMNEEERDEVRRGRAERSKPFPKPEREVPKHKSKSCPRCGESLSVYAVTCRRCKADVEHVGAD